MLLRTALAIVLGAATLAGCGGGSSAVPTTDRETQVILAVCESERRGVPPVPAPSAGRTEQRRYVEAVGRAAGRLADALALLDKQQPSSPHQLAKVAADATKVRTLARSSAAQLQAAEGTPDELRIAIARLNDDSTTAGLPACGV